jgi:hypothetical protein
LWSVHRDDTDIASSVTNTEGMIRVPAYEQWLVTEFAVFRGSSGSTAAATTFSLLDDSTLIADIVSASSATNLIVSTNLTPTAGEYEGVLVDALSTLSVTILRAGGSTTAPCSNVTMSIFGYIRFKNSTRAE